jgi:predicted transcriptional regulator of viral defense system
METGKYLEKLYKSEKTFFTPFEIGEFLDIQKRRTREDFVRRLKKQGVLVQLEKGKYYVSSKDPFDFEIANFLISTSYISFETALNHYGILPQFPFEITSATLTKTKKKEILGKTYSYSKIAKDLFTGFQKEDGFLIALPEKALFDYLYLITRNVKTENYLDEMDFSRIRKKTFKNFFSLVSAETGEAIYKLLEKYYDF